MNVSKEVAVFSAKPEDFALARAALQLILPACSGYRLEESDGLHRNFGP